MRNLGKIGVVTGLSMFWAVAVWAEPQAWQLASVNSQAKVSDVFDTREDLEAAKKIGKKKFYEGASADDAITAEPLKMSDVNNTREDLEFAKKKGKK
jgi:hypothetical protein